MDDLQLTLDGVSRSFGRRLVFRDVTATVHVGEALVVAGANGSGKSTLLKIAASLLAPTSGHVRVRRGAQELAAEQRRDAIGYVSPDLSLYGELTGAENLQFFARLRGVELGRDRLVELLERVGLKGRGRDLAGSYSSGMKQRLKYAFALLHRPAILLLDEPTANLDTQGVAMVEDIVSAQRRLGLVVIATNEAREVAWGDTVVRLGSPAGPAA